MATKNEIYVCNLAQEKLGDAHLAGSVLDPNTGLPKVAHQRYDLIYHHWRVSEIKKRRWVFALDFGACTLVESSGEPVLTADPALPYQFEVPAGCIKPLRDKDSDWTMRGSRLHRASSAPLSIQFLRDVTDVTLMDDLFIDVLAARLAYEAAEKVANIGADKRRGFYTDYENVVIEAGKQNAFLKEPVDYGSDDTEFSWLTSMANGI